MKPRRPNLIRVGAGRLAQNRDETNHATFFLRVTKLGPQPMCAARPLHPRKPTCRACLVMSQKCQHRTLATQQTHSKNAPPYSSVSRLDGRSARPVLKFLDCRFSAGLESGDGWES